MKQKRVDERLKRQVRKKLKKRTIVTGGGTNVLVQESITNNITQGVNLLVALEDVYISDYPADGDILVYDEDSGLWVNEQPDPPSESGESIFFLEDEADPDIAGYKVMDNPAQLVAEAYVTQSTIADEQIIQEWITDVGLPGVTFIPDGIWSTHINVYKTGGTKEVRIYTEYYKRVLAGTETLLGTSANSLPLSEVETQRNFSIFLSGITVLATDRIVKKVRMRLVGGGSNPTSVTLGYSGTTAARLSIPAQAGSGGGSPGGASNLTAVLTEGNDGGGLQIKNIADPTLAQDAATRNYVDTRTANYNLFLYYNFY